MADRHDYEKPGLAPAFDGSPPKYREYRRRALLFRRKMVLEKRGNVAALTLMGALTGAAWEAVESIDESKLETEDGSGVDVILGLLDIAFKYDDRTELPHAFENYFFKSGRYPREALIDYVQRFRQARNRVEEFKITMPPEVHGWLLLRRSRIRAEQRAMVLAQAGKDLSMEKVTELLNLMLGQDSVPTKSEIINYVDPVDEEAYYGESAEWNYDHGDYEDEESYDPALEDLYYQGEQPTGEQDVDEYDEVYANYQEARQRMNQLKLARGFYPVVAMVPGMASGTSSAPAPSPNPRGTTTKGKGKKGRKGVPNYGSYTSAPGNRTTPTSPGKGSSAKDRSSATRQDPMVVCLRCGERGHYARDCPKPPSAKRTRTENDSPVYMVSDCHRETLAHPVALMNGQPDSQSRQCSALWDCGATAVIIGKNTLLSLVQIYRQNLMPEIHLVRTYKKFRYGNDQVGTSEWAALLPVILHPLQGLLFVYVVEGNTPLLLARPIAHALGVTINFGDNTATLKDGRVLEVAVDMKGHLAMNIVSRPWKKDIMDFTLIPEEELDPNVDLEQHQYTIEEAMASMEDDHRAVHHEAVNNWRTLTMKKLHCPTLPVQISQNEETETQPLKLKGPIKKKILGTMRNWWDTQEALLSSGPEPIHVWEVFAGQAATSEELRRMGCEVLTFGLPEWNFYLHEHRRAFFDLLYTVKPKEILLAPPCSPWSQIQRTNQRTPQQIYHLNLKRSQDEVLLTFTRQVLEAQEAGGRFAHIENPQQSAAWNQPSFQDMPGGKSTIHQCAYGLRHPVNGLPMKKPTTFHSNKPSFLFMLRDKCTCDKPHAVLQGYAAGFGPVTRYAENYPKGLAVRLAEAMTYDGPAEFAYPVHEANPDLGDQDVNMEMNPEEEQEVEAQEAEANVEDERLTERQKISLRRLHRVMGHPSPEVLSRTLSLAGMSREAIDYVKNHLTCAICDGRMRVQRARVSIPIKTTVFNEYIQIDVFYIQLKDNKAKILTIIDVASRYLVCRRVADETTSSLIRAIERGWIKVFGPPTVLRGDAASGTTSHQMLKWSDSMGIKLDVIPGEAHWRIGVVERSHQVMREALERFMESISVEEEGTARLPDDADLDLALTYVPSNHNRLAFTKGYTPAQWVLGIQPRVTASLLNGHEDFQLAEHSQALNDNTFAVRLEMRTAAATAFIQADASQRIRRALLRKAHADRREVNVGESVYYWRNAGEGNLNKARWRGPAIVTMKETSETGSPTTYWLVHGTRLIRAVPEQVRPAANGEQALEAGEGMARAEQLLRGTTGSGGTTSFVDLPREDVPMHSDDEEDLHDPERHERDANPGDTRPRVPHFGPGPSTPGRDHNLGAEANTPVGSHDTNNTETVDENTPVEENTPISTTEPFLPTAQSPSEDPPGFEPQMETENPPGYEPQVEPTPTSPANSPADPQYTPTSPADSLGDEEVDDTMIDPSPDSWAREVRSPAGQSFRSSQPAEQQPQYGPMRRPDHRSRSEPFDVMVVAEELFVANEVGTKLLHKSLPPDWTWNGDSIFLANSISTKNMTPSERTAFLQDKRRELTDFFDNKVWEFDVESNSDPSRTMRAKWILKWSTYEDGSPRAKARLVIQGFKDPDALNGSLYTSSPTATRVAKSLLLMEAARRKWKVFTADVATAFLQAADKDRGIHVQLPADALVLLGADAKTRMRLHKPMYGLPDAPRGWFEEAVRRSKEIGVVQHPLDPCLFLSFRDNGELDGGFTLHVDDLLGAGDETDHGPNSFAQRKKELKKIFKFRSWIEDSSLSYCGTDIVQNDGEIRVSMKTYLKKLAPITVNKDRRNHSSVSCTPKEVTQLRGLLGGLQWPAGQAMPHLQASVSLLQGQISRSTIGTINEVNRTLKFAKEYADVGLHYQHDPTYNHNQLPTFIVFSDAALATREDLSSQGGYLILAAHPRILDGETVPIQVVDWSSKKLTRVSRSSLNSEAQAAATAVDALEFVKTFYALMLDPRRDPRQDSTMQDLGMSALVVDAKALYDAAVKDGLSSVTDKRTAIEVTVIKERMRACGAMWRWVSSERQLADGLTKEQARKVLADALRSGTLRLVHDPTFTAAKKKSCGSIKKLNPEENFNT